MRLGSFELVEELGTGSFGAVWAARKTSDGEPIFAIKILADWALDRDGEERFRDELAVLSGLSHPHIVNVLESGTVPPMRASVGGSAVAGAPWYAMDRAIGTLSDRRPALSQVGGVLEDLLGGLAVIHARGVVHGDLSPGNILRSADGRFLISDFGAAYFRDERRGGGFGTRGFAAPELAGGPPTPSTDLYAIGRIALQLLAAADTRDHPLRQWAESMCSESLDDRPSSAAQAIRELRAAQGLEPAGDPLHWTAVWREIAPQNGHPLWRTEQMPELGDVLTKSQAQWLKTTRSACGAGETLIVESSPRGGLDALRATAREVTTSRGTGNRSLRIALAAPPMTWFESDTTRFSVGGLAGLLAAGDRPVLLLPTGLERLKDAIGDRLRCWSIQPEARRECSETYEQPVLAMIHVLGGGFDAARLRDLCGPMDITFSHSWLPELRERGLVLRVGSTYSALTDDRVIDDDVMRHAWAALATIEVVRPTPVGITRLANAGLVVPGWNVAAMLGSQFDLEGACALAEQLIRGPELEWLRARLELAVATRGDASHLAEIVATASDDGCAGFKLLAFDACMLAGRSEDALKLATAAWDSATLPHFRAAATLARARALHETGSDGPAADECIRAAERFRRLDDHVHVALCDELRGHLMIAVGSVERGREVLGTAGEALAKRGAGYPALRAIAAARGRHFDPPDAFDLPTNGPAGQPLGVQ